MTEEAREGRRSDDIAGELHQIGREALLDGDSRPLFLGSKRFDGAELAKGLTAPFVDDSCCGAYVGVGELGDVLLQEVDEPAIPLQESQELEGPVGGRKGVWEGLTRGGSRWEGVGLGSCSEVRCLVGEVSLEQDSEEAREREEDAL